MNFTYRLGWLGFRAMYATYFRWRVFNAGARAANRRGHSRLQPRELSRPAAGRFGLEARHQLSRPRKLFRFPGIGALLRSWNAVPVDRDGGGAAGLKAILDRLLAGGGIILFPEGTRTRDGKLQPARSGIGLMVIKSDAPVVPVRTFGTFEAYGRHVKISAAQTGGREIRPADEF